MKKKYYFKKIKYNNSQNSIDHTGKQNNDNNWQKMMIIDWNEEHEEYVIVIASDRIRGEAYLP